jgi:hypothetical protein
MANGLLGDVRDQFIAEAKQLGNSSASFTENNARRSINMRKRHPNESYFESYVNFSQSGDEVIGPMVRMIMEQPDKNISDIFEFKGYDDVEKNRPKRKTRLRGRYVLSEDKTKLIRDPIVSDFGKVDPSYEPYAMARPYFTKLGNDFTAAHEMVHAALNRDVSEEGFLAKDQHEFLDYYLGKTLLDNEDFWKSKYGEKDYSFELMNNIINEESKFKKIKPLLDELKDMSVGDLKNRLQGVLDYQKKYRNPEKIKDMINFDAIKEITGKPESKVLRGK